MKKVLFIIVFFYINLCSADEDIYQAEYKPLKCIGVVSEYEKRFMAKWTFKATG
jgi:hypothetical protein